MNSKGFSGLPEYPLLIALSLLAIILCAPIDNPYENPENIGIALSVAGSSDMQVIKTDKRGLKIK
jgi:hypothetical protein